MTVAVFWDRYVLAQNVPAEGAGLILSLLQNSFVVSIATVFVNKFVRAWVVDPLARSNQQHQTQHIYT